MHHDELIDLPILALLKKLPLSLLLSLSQDYLLCNLCCMHFSYQNKLLPKMTTTKKQHSQSIPIKKAWLKPCFFIKCAISTYLKLLCD